MAPKIERCCPRISASGAQFATIIVGEEQERFVVHETLLTHYSAFFRAALTGSFKEAKDKSVTLSEDGPEVFELFVHWLYYQRFPDKAKGDDEQLLDLYVDQEGDGCLEKERLIHLYVLGDQYDVPGLRRCALDELHRLLDDNDDIDLPAPCHIKFAFAKLQSNSPLCRYLVDAECYWADAGVIAEWGVDEVPASVWAAIARRYAEIVNTDGRAGVGCFDYKLNLCDYHEHASKEERKACEAEREAE